MTRPRSARHARAPLSSRLGTATLSFLRSTVPVLGIMLVVRIALAEPYHIPSESMEPTLLKGDWLYVNKLRFGPHIPFTNVALPGYAEPKRGDVVVFVSPPQDLSIRITPDDITPTLVKRIAGIPGDTLQMRAGRLFVNGIPDAMPAPHTDSAYDAPQPLFEWQRGIEIHGSRFGAAPRELSVHNWGPLVVPPKTFFMMGDNRDDSVDSRFYGVVPRENLRGTPMFVYYSYDTDAGLDWFRAVTEIRWKRLGTFIR